MNDQYAPQGDESTEAYAERLRSLLKERDAKIEALQSQLLPSKPNNVSHGGYVSSEKKAKGAERPLHSVQGKGVANEGNKAQVLESGPALEEAEALLAKRSQAEANPMVQQLLSSLGSAIVYTDTANNETNQKLWDAYARSWSPSQDWVKKMASHLPGDTRELACVGDEWSDETSLDKVFKDWLMPHLSSSAKVAEIGSGGGRIAGRVVQHVGNLVCFDVSSEMLKKAEAHLKAQGSAENTRFVHVSGEESCYPAEFDGHFDFVYSFDVMVHVDLHQMWRILRQIRRMLLPGGKAFISVANLLAPGGWSRFAKQKKYSVGGFYFISPDIASCLVSNAGLEMVAMSTTSPDNTYLNRDLLLLLQAPPKP